MPVLEEDHKQYREFVEKQVKALRSLEFNPDQIIWHYTTGPALISIVESGVLFATQVSCLNDSTEIRYSSNLLREAFGALQGKAAQESETRSFLDRLTAALADEPENPSHAPSMYFVTCFTEQEDDLSQWRAYCGGENGYAIGFKASGLFGRDPNSLIVRVNYDRKQHEEVANQIANATVQFWREGLEKNRAPSPEKWTEEFLAAWVTWIGRLAPMVKDDAFSGEKEYRIVHELQVNELGRIRFMQKTTLMSRYLSLDFPTGITRFHLLPIMGVRIGPGRHKAISRLSVDTLLRQNGYAAGLVSVSRIPFQAA